MLPLVFSFIAFVGIAASSAGQVKYGLAEIPWDPNVLISHWESRACRFFAGFSFALASLGVNISANTLSAANDFAALAPRYINIRRGQLLCGLLIWALVPWKILESAGNFLNFMSAYAIFLGPIAAIMVFDFWVVKRAKYDVVALYQPDNPIYGYDHHGINWRAVIAFLCGVAPSLPGLINSVNSNINPGVGVYPYDIGWLIGFVGTSVVYLALSHFFPAKHSLLDRAVLPDEVYDSNSSSSSFPFPPSSTPPHPVVIDGHEPPFHTTIQEEAKHNGIRADDGVETEQPQLSGFKKFAQRMDRLL